MEFLKYVEHSAENLQFFLWFKDYVKRFEALPVGERNLSPDWTPAQEDAENAAYRNQLKQKPLAVEANEILKSQNLTGDIEPQAPSEKQDPFSDSKDLPSPGSKFGDSKSPSFEQSVTGFQSVKTGHSRGAEAAYDDAGCKFQPCEFEDLLHCFIIRVLTSKVTVQPFREEMSRIITVYIADGAPRQLNLSSRERTALLHALEVTTHPSAFRSVVKTVEVSLRRQAHPNFIRWSICNGNRPRVIFARGLGVGGIVAGILTALLITLSSAGRAWRVIALVPFLIGIATLIAAWKGMCVVSSNSNRTSQYVTNLTSRFSMACITAISAPGSSLPTTRKVTRKWTSRKLHSIARTPRTAMKTSLGFPSTRNVTLFARSLIARSGSRNPLSDRFKIRSSSRRCLVRL
jgi:hypothetical protein